MLVFPNAKINIGLNITEKRVDGFHNLETVFYPIPWYDILEIREANKFAITTSGVSLDIPPEKNLVVKAFRLLQKDYKLPEIEIALHKNIPAGAGLGGGSADASFMLRVVNERFRLQLSNQVLETYASQLGSDCPFFINNKPTFAEGTGNKFTSIELDLSSYEIRTEKPDVFVSTADAFSGITPQKTSFDLTESIKKPIHEWKNFIFNGFETTVFAKHPIIADLKSKMYDDGALYASMSGSGAAVFGIFDKYIN